MSKYIGGYEFWQSKISHERSLIIIEELAYSFHLGNDKNKTKKARQIARNTKTGTTSFSNNGIQNAKQLSKVFNHNFRMYDNKQDEIVILKGSNNLIKDVKDLYLDLFEESRIKYNEKRTRSDRKIDNYFDNISNNDKSDLACEIIIELGDMEFWADKSKDYRIKMNDVYTEQIKYLEKIVPNFKVASAVSHFDENSPHLHIVGVPFKEGNKNGMEITVGKSAIFTKDSLKVIQDKMRINCIETFNQIYANDLTLKQKRKGRNQDISVSEMEGYKQTEKALKKEIKELEEVKATTAKDIDQQVKEKTEIEDEIADKKKYNRKLSLKSKVMLIKENEQLKKELASEKREHHLLKYKYDDLKEKTDYLINEIKNVLSKIPKAIANIIEKVFDKNIPVNLFEAYHKDKDDFKPKPIISKKSDYNYEKEYKRDKSKEKDDFEL